MENFLRRRVRERLDALGLNAFEAARMAGGERGFLRDLLSGKKHSIRPAALARVAEVLECDPEYLIGAQSTPRQDRARAAGMMPLAGIAEAGAWRARDAEPMAATVPVAADPRYPPERQAAYLIRGHHADALGLMDGDVVIAVADDAARDGDIVIVRRRMESGEVELAARLIEGGEIRAGAGLSLSPRQMIEGSDIAGRIIGAHRIFGRM